MGKATKKIIKILYAFLFFWTAAEVLVAYQLKWMNFKDSFQSIVDNRDQVLLNKAKNIKVNDNLNFIKETSHHTVVYMLKNIKVDGKLKNLYWSEHYAFSEFNVNQISFNINRK